MLELGNIIATLMKSEREQNMCPYCGHPDGSHSSDCPSDKKESASKGESIEERMETAETIKSGANNAVFLKIEKIIKEKRTNKEKPELSILNSIPEGIKVPEMKAIAEDYLEIMHIMRNEIRPYEEKIENMERQLESIKDKLIINHLEELTQGSPGGYFQQARKLLIDGLPLKEVEIKDEVSDDISVSLTRLEEELLTAQDTINFFKDEENFSPVLFDPEGVSDDVLAEITKKNKKHMALITKPARAISITAKLKFNLEAEQAMMKKYRELAPNDGTPELESMEEELNTLHEKVSLLFDKLHAICAKGEVEYHDLTFGMPITKENRNMFTPVLFNDQINTKDHLVRLMITSPDTLRVFRKLGYESEYFGKSSTRETEVPIIKNN